jgi:hypothetical protein
MRWLPREEDFQGLPSLLDEELRAKKKIGKLRPLYKLSMPKTGARVEDVENLERT